MYDLSWLNPTPRAIAVYASQPLSPVATQHSLPSGRYSLLGPDFHRLDRTSFVLAHLFDHLVGSGEQCGRNFKPERLRGLYVDGELESRRLFERQVGGLRALENAVDKGRHASEVLVEIRAVRHQTAIVNKKVKFVDGRQSMRRGVLEHPLTVENCERVGDHQDRVRLLAIHRRERLLEVVGLAHAKRLDADAKGVGTDLGRAVAHGHAEIR